MRKYPGLPVEGATNSPVVGVSWRPTESPLGSLIVPAAPVNLVVPSITPQPGYVGTVFTAHPGVWTGYPIPDFTYQWQLGGVDIPGATNQTYQAESAGNLTVNVSASNSEGSAGPAQSVAYAVTAAPTYSVSFSGLDSGDIVIGTPVTASVSGFNLGAPASVNYRWYSVADDTLLSSTDSYTASPGMNLSNVYLVVTPSAPYSPTQSSDLLIRFEPPQAIGSLANVEYDTGSGNKTVDASVAFSGGGIVFSVSSGLAGVTITPITGVVTIPTSADDTGTVIVTATNSGGTAEVSFGVSITTPDTVPAQMIAPSLTVLGADSISVDRASAPDNGGSPILSYDLRWSVDQTTWTEVTGISDPETVSGLTGSTQHYVQTRAVNAIGAGSWSASAMATTDSGLTVPAQMLVPTATAISHTQVSVALGVVPDDGGAPVTSYDLRHSTDQSSWTVLTGVSDPQSVSGLSSGVQYYFQTRAVNSEGPGAWSSSDTATTHAVPSQMSAPTVSSTGETSISVDLASAPSNNGATITSYDLRYSDDEASWITVSDVSDPASVSGLTEDTTYYVQTRAVNAVGTGPWSTSGSATTEAGATVPGQMVAPVLSATGPTAISVDRANAPADGGSTILSYDMRWSPDQSDWTTVFGISDPQALSSLEQATLYYVQTRAVNAEGPGPWSPSASVTTHGVPAQMSAPAVSAAGPTSISVDRASAPANGGSAITSYDLRWSDDQLSWTTVLGISDPDTVGSLASATTYYVQTRANNAVGSGAWSASGSAVTETADTAPAQMAAPTVTTLSGTSINVARADDPANGGQPITRFDLRYSTDETNWTEMQDVSLNQTVSGLANGTTYYVQTRAVNSVGLGAWSVSDSTATLDVPAQMSAPTVTVLSGVSLQVARAAAPADGGSTITAYKLRYSTDESTWIEVEDIANPETISGLLNGTLYYVQTIAQNAVGDGAWSSSGTATTYNVPAQMVAPTVFATSGTAISVDLGAAPSNGGQPITSYDLRHSTDETTWTTVTGVSDPQSVSSLALGTTYYVQTRAVNSVGAAPWSVSETVTTLNVPSAMSAPTFSLVEYESATVIRGAAPSNGGSAITGYEMQYRPSSGGAWTSVDPFLATEDLTGLTNDTEYEAQQRAVNAVGSGPWSPSGTFTTDALPDIQPNAGNTADIFVAEGQFTITISGASVSHHNGTFGPFDTSAFTGGPINLVAPVVSGTAGTGETLTAEPGLWIFPSDDVPTVTTEWISGGTGTGDTDASYLTGAGDEENDVLYRETATNTAGARSSDSNAISIPSSGGPDLWEFTGSTATNVPNVSTWAFTGSTVTTVGDN